MTSECAIVTAVIVVLLILVVALMLIVLVLEVLGHVHPQLILLVAVAIEHVLSALMALAEHAEGGRVSAGRAVWRRSVVVVKTDSRVIDGRPVPLVELSRVV